MKLQALSVLYVSTLKQRFTRASKPSRDPAHKSFVLSFKKSVVAAGSAIATHSPELPLLVARFKPKSAQRSVACLSTVREHPPSTSADLRRK